MTKLQEFQSLLDSYPVLGGERHDARFRREQERLFKKHYPRKRKVNWCLVSGTEEGKKLEEKYTRLAKDFHERYRKRKKLTEEKLCSLAREIEVTPSSDRYTYVDCISSSDYHTQTNEHKYASEHAQRIADKFERYDIPSYVRQVVRSKGRDILRHKYTIINYEIWAQIDETGIEIINRKPGLSLKEWMKQCWGRGVNPRVMNPFIPAGLENKLGIDYFGRDIKKGEEK